MSPAVRRLVASSLLASALAAGGCSSAPGASDEAAKPAAQILADSRAAMSRLSSVHITGVVAAASPPVSFDVVDGQADGGGTFTQGSQFSVVRTGSSLFVEAPAGFWSQQGLSAADAQAIGGQWLKTTTSVKDLAPLADVTAVRWWLSHATTANLAGKGAVTTFHGRRVVTLLGGGGSRIYVALDGAPYWLGSSDRAGDDAVFDEFDAATVPAPPAHYLDVTKFSQGS